LKHLSLIVTTPVSDQSASAPGLTLERIAGNFAALDDWEQRFGYLLDLGKKLPPMDAADKTEASRVHGCQATVFMKPRLVGAPPHVHLSAWADAATVCGLITILLTMYSGKSPQEIASIDAESYFTKLGLEDHLSPTRRNGLHSMIQRIRAIAQQAMAAPQTAS
jgi:cysteine desulfuration protein SufE